MNPNVDPTLDSELGVEEQAGTGQGYEGGDETRGSVS